MLRVAELWISDNKKESAIALLAEAEKISKRRISRNRKKRTTWEYINTLLDIQNRLFELVPSIEILDLLDIPFATQHAVTDELRFFYKGFEYLIKINASDKSYEFMGNHYADIRELLDFGEINGTKLRTTFNGFDCTMKSDIMTPKKYNNVGFRGLDQQFCIISLASNKTLENPVLLGIFVPYFSIV